MKYILDTNTCISLIRRQSERVYEQLAKQRINDVGVSVITVAELQFGVAKSRNPEHNRVLLEQFLVALTIADFDALAAAAYAQVRAHLESKGKPIGSMDMLIAAHALRLDAVLVTNNVKEFARVPDLRIEDWTKH